jgi:hypothetical protein
MSVTLRFHSRRIKRKAGLRCAEAVNVGDSLWKAQENPSFRGVALTLLGASSRPGWFRRAARF